MIQVGSWSAMTGYGLAFPLNSKHKARFNDMLLEYKENGDLERLSRYVIISSLTFDFSLTNCFLDTGCMEFANPTCKRSE